VLQLVPDGVMRSDIPDGAAFLRCHVTDDMSRTDLRCIVGLRVVVHGPLQASSAVMAACKAAVGAKAASVLGFASDGSKLTADSMVFIEGDFEWLN